MRASRAVLTMAVLLGSSALAVGVATGPALADSHPLLDIASFGDIAVDAVHKRVFVSDPTTGKIVVTDYKGAEVAELSGLPGVGGLALSADSSRLYAAVSQAHAIVAIVTGTATEAERYPVGDTVYPQDVTPAGGKLWFGYSDGSSGGNYGSVDPADATVHLRTGLDINRWYGAPYLYSSTAVPGKLMVLHNDGSSSGELALVDVSSGAEAEVAQDDRLGSFNEDAAFTADGSHLVHVANGAEWLVQLSDMTTTMTYPSVYRANGVDVASDGRIAITGNNSDSDADIYVYAAGAASPAQTIALPRVDGEWNNEEVVDRSVAWQPGGPRLFAVGQNDDGGYRLWTLNEPSPSIATMTVNVPATATRAKPLAISGTLTADPQLPAGTEVVVTKTDLEVSYAPVCVTTTDAAGAFGCTDTPAVGGTVSYRAAFAGNDDYTAAADLTATTIPRATPVLTLSSNGAVYAYGTTATFTAALGATYKNRTVEIWADPYGSDQVNRLLKKATVNSAGKLAASFKLTRNATLTAKFPGDARYAPRSVTSTVYTKVPVGIALSKHYKTGKIGSTKYYYVHKKTHPNFTTTIPYYANRKQKVIVQYYAKGKWRAWSSGFIPVETNGKSYSLLDGSHPVDVRFRVRSAYLKGTSGDNVNYTSYGTWKNFIFKK